MTRRVIEQFATGRPGARRTRGSTELTEREREIVAWVATGRSNDEIAEALVISPATVRTHVSRAMLKLGARDRAQLVVFAIESGLQDRPVLTRPADPARPRGTGARGTDGGPWTSRRRPRTRARRHAGGPARRPAEPSARGRTGSSAPGGRPRAGSAGRRHAPDAAGAGRDVVRARPVRLRRVAFGIAAVVVVLFVVIAALLGRTSSEGVEFGPGDQVAMVLLGVLVAAGVLLLARPTVVADLHGVRVQNIFTTKDVPWEVVRAVSFPDGYALGDAGPRRRRPDRGARGAGGRRPARGRRRPGAARAARPARRRGRSWPDPRVHMG